MNDYPEHDKMKRIKTESQYQGKFLDWLLHEKEYALCKLDGDRNPRYEPIRQKIEELLAEFHEIDLKKIAEEKDAMLDFQRQINERRAK